MESTQRKPVPRVKITLGLLAILIVVLFLLIWIPYRTRQSAISALAHLNPEITFAEGGPRWLRLFIGNRNMQAFDHVTAIRFKPVPGADPVPVTDADLIALSKFPYLGELSLINAPITDEGLKSLAELPYLKSLFLTNTKITDAGLVHLSKMRFLFRLSLAGTKITDAGVKSLLPLKGLASLSLAETAITDAGLEPLDNFKRLESLDLSGTKVTDAGILLHLKNLDSLRDAAFADTAVSPAGLKALRQILTGANLIRVRPGAKKASSGSKGAGSADPKKGSNPDANPKASDLKAAVPEGDGKPPADVEKKK